MNSWDTYVPNFELMDEDKTPPMHPPVLHEELKVIHRANNSRCYVCGHKFSESDVKDSYNLKQIHLKDIIEKDHRIVWTLNLHLNCFNFYVR